MKSSKVLIASLLLSLFPLHASNASDLKCAIELQGYFDLAQSAVTRLLAQKGYEVLAPGAKAPCAIVSSDYSEVDGDYKGVDFMQGQTRIKTLDRKLGFFFMHRQGARMETHFILSILPACTEMGACQKASN